jgi:uncharacterized protein YrrD
MIFISDIIVSDFIVSNGIISDFIVSNGIISDLIVSNGIISNHITACKNLLINLLFFLTELDKSETATLL